jgi:hypothetical protein
MTDDNYYDINGIKLCDRVGNIFVNDGNNIYDIETSLIYEDDEDNKNSIYEIYIVSLTVTCFVFIFGCMRFTYDFFYNTLKNRDE